MSENPDGLGGSKKRYFEKFTTRAEEYKANPDKTKELGDKAFAKANRNKGALDKVWDDLQTLIRLVKAWATRKYTGIPVKSILMIIAALIYFISPVDAIPDFIFVLGLLDDAAVLSFVIGALRSDLEDFRRWEEQAS